MRIGHQGQPSPVRERPGLADNSGGERRLCPGISVALEARYDSVTEGAAVQQPNGHDLAGLRVTESLEGPTEEADMADDHDVARLTWEWRAWKMPGTSLHRGFGGAFHYSDVQVDRECDQPKDQTTRRQRWRWRG